VVISYIYATPTGASVVMINIFAFLLFWGINTFTNAFIKRRVTMKSISLILVVSIVSVFLLACGAGTERASGGKAVDKKAVERAAEKRSAEEKIIEKKVVEITEKMFIAQTNDIYLNAEDYIGSTIKLQGLFKKAQYETRDDPYCFVLRYGPGCCGYDGNAGFEVAFRGGEGAYPGEDDWVEAVGVLKTYTEDDYPYLYIELSSLDVLDERGAEFVTQ
jgi:hypothetical protein